MVEGNMRGTDVLDGPADLQRLKMVRYSPQTSRDATRISPGLGDRSGETERNPGFCWIYPMAC